MPLPSLSICIPSYQRAELLGGLLSELDRPGYLPFTFDVIVVDNASPTDAYADIAAFAPRHYALAYYRNEHNIGPIANLFGALRRARGELCLYLGDDDRLVPAALADAVQLMLESPEIVATQCCWQEQDLVTGIVTPAALPFNDRLFSSLNAGSLIRAYLHTRFMPEIGVYRTDILTRCLWPTEIFFWPFRLTERLLRLGAIRVTDQPFYTIVSRHPGETAPRETLTSSTDIAIWEKVARSFDFLMLRYFGALDLPPELTLGIELAEMRNWFFEQAMIMHFRRGDFLTAHELSALLAARGGPSSFLTKERSNELDRRAGLAAFARALTWTPEIHNVALIGFNADVATELATILRIELPAHIALGTSGLEHSAILVDTDAERDALIERGIMPGMAHSLETLRLMF